MTDAIIHLTQRALWFLKHRNTTLACEWARAIRRPEAPWVGNIAEEMNNAIGDMYSYISACGKPHLARQSHLTLHEVALKQAPLPTCPECAVLYDEAMENPVSEET